MIFAAVVAAIALVACSKTENRSCYKASYTMPAQAEVVDSLGEVVREARVETKVSIYKWATKAEIEACRKNWEEMGYKNVLTEEANTTSEGKQVKTMTDCLQMNTAE